MALRRMGAVGGRNGGQPVTGGARGRARAAARRAPKGAKAELPVRLAVSVPRACARPVRPFVTSHGHVRYSRGPGATRRAAWSARL